jgi:hypothetical protein
VAVPDPEVFGAKNQVYMPPPVEEHIVVCQHSAKPLDGVKLAGLAKKFADSIPDEEFSVAALRGCELANFLRFVVGLLFLFPSSLRVGVGSEEISLTPFAPPS